MHFNGTLVHGVEAVKMNAALRPNATTLLRESDMAARGQVKCVLDDVFPLPACTTQVVYLSPITLPQTPRVLHCHWASRNGTTVTRNKNSYFQLQACQAVLWVQQAQASNSVDASTHQALINGQNKCIHVRAPYLIVQDVPPHRLQEFLRHHLRESQRTLHFPVGISYWNGLLSERPTRLASEGIMQMKRSNVAAWRWSRIRNRLPFLHAFRACLEHVLLSDQLVHAEHVRLLAHVQCRVQFHDEGKRAGVRSSRVSVFSCPTQASNHRPRRAALSLVVAP